MDGVTERDREGDSGGKGNPPTKFQYTSIIAQIGLVYANLAWIAFYLFIALRVEHSLS